ncbi:MAG: hypothetical protein ISS77_05970 [Phycisphaerae bacterium]|nr:hypothetical protein [Phycisphaerae bacterium]
MKNLIAKIIFCICFFAFARGLRASEPNTFELKDQTQVKIAIIYCKDLIDDGLYKSIVRRTNLALDQGAEYLIYDIQTYGGLVKAADDISKFLIYEAAKKAHTVAYVTTEAISAGAMISVSCRDIVMLENRTIGDAAPIVLGGKLEGVEREKQESFIRSIFRRAAQANNYPEVLLEAMVSVQTEVYRVKNIETSEFEFFKKDTLPKDPNLYDIANKELVSREGELLTLTSSEALKYGLARAEVENIDGMLGYFEQRDGVSFQKSPLELRTIWSEDMVRLINHPAVMSVLVLVALLGVYIELNTPGIGLPGLVALICFVIIIGSKYLTGLANWVEVALFVSGLILLCIEVFILPGFGIAGTLGIIFIITGLFGMLVKNPPDQIPWPEDAESWQIFTNGAMGLVFGFFGFLIFAWAFTRYLPKMQFLGGLILKPSLAKTGTEIEISLTAPAGEQEKKLKIGDTGEVVTALRPAGKVDFDEKIVDCVAQGDFIDKGDSVEIADIHGNRVIVRKI